MKYRFCSQLAPHGAHGPKNPSQSVAPEQAGHCCAVASSGHAHTPVSALQLPAGQPAHGSMLQNESTAPALDLNPLLHVHAVFSSLQLP